VKNDWADFWENRSASMSSFPKLWFRWTTEESAAKKDEESWSGRGSGKPMGGKRKVLAAPPGEHAVLFNDGSSYSGEWMNGEINGRGVFLWRNGDRFEGEWKNGLQNGQGTFAAADGSVYYGGWKLGKKDGEGVFKPAGSKVVDTSVLYLRKYRSGELVRNIRLEMATDRDRQQFKDMKKSIVERPLKPGEVVYKGHRSYDLMRQLQIGVMYSIAQAGPLDLQEKLHKQDFQGVLVQYFPESGDLPAFKYKEYAPKVFQKLRKSFGIDNADFLVSLTGGPALREMPSPGSSGCIFFLSEDDRFLIKSVRKEEMSMLLNLMNRYESHVRGNPTTLIVRFYGIHRVSPWFGRNARFLIMGNVLPTEKRMHRKYDLKGSTYKRTVGKDRLNDPGATLKDLDLDMQLELSSERYSALMEMLESDVKFLKSMRSIDYSLLLGVHFISWGETGWYPPKGKWHQGSSRSLSANGRSGQSSLALSRKLVQNLEEMIAEDDNSIYMRNAADLIASANSVRDAARSTAASAASFMEFSSDPPSGHPSGSMRNAGDGVIEIPAPIADEDFPHERWKRHSEMEGQIGWATPAIAVRVSDNGSTSRQPVLLYFGIIDFVQKYNTRKRLEKIWKTTLHGNSVSVADPKHYASRFLNFLRTVFIQEPND